MALRRTVQLWWQADRLSVAGFLAAIALSHGLSTVQLAVLGVVVDRVVARQPTTAWVVALVAGFVVQRVAGVATSSLQAVAQARIAARAVQLHMQAATRLEARQLERPGVLDAVRDAAHAAEFAAGSALFYAGSTFGATIGLLGLTGLLVVVSPPVAALVLLAAVPWVVADHRGFGEVRRASVAVLPLEREQRYLQDLVSQPESGLELRASGAGGKLAERHGRLVAEELGIVLPAHRAQLRWVVAGQVVSAAFLVAAFLLTVRKVGEGSVSAGQTAAALAALSALLQATANLANGVGGLRTRLVVLRQLFALFDTEPELPVPAVPTTLPDRLTVQLEDVTYRYPGRSATRSPA